METPQVRRGDRDGLDVAWVGVAILVPVFVALVTPLRMVDLAYHVRLGNDMIQAERLIDADTLTFTLQGTSWINQQWLAQVLLAGVHRLGGWHAVVLARGLAVAMSSGFLYLASREKGARPRTAALLTLTAFVVALPSLAMRPQMFGVVLFAAALWMVAGRARRPRRLWWLPILALLGANLHGSFPLILLVAVLATAEDLLAKRPARQVLGVTVLTALATLVNPYGIRVWAYAWTISTNDQIRNAVTEWEPLAFRDYLGILTFLSLGALLWYLGRRARRVRWFDLVWLSVFLLPALLAERAVAWWAMVATVVVAGLLGGASLEPLARVNLRRLTPPAIAVLVALIFAVGMAAAGPTLGRDVVIRDAPPGLEQALAASPGGSGLWIHQPWASWVELTSPHVLVFVDSRIELFPRGVWQDYTSVAFSRADWREALGRWRPDAIVADKESWDLLPFLRDAETWEVAAEDDDFVLFTRVG